MGCSASSCTPGSGKRILRWPLLWYFHWLSLYQPLLWYFYWLSLYQPLPWYFYWLSLYQPLLLYFYWLSFIAQPWQRGLWELRRAWKSAKEDEREGLGGGCGGEQDWEPSRTHPAANILVKGDRNHPVPSEILRICKFLESTFSILWSWFLLTNIAFQASWKGISREMYSKGVTIFVEWVAM